MVTNDFKNKKKVEGLSKVNRLYSCTFTMVYASYLTLRYVDEYENFPAFKFTGYMKFRVRKRSKARLVIKKGLILSPWILGDRPTIIDLAAGSLMEVHNEFMLGDGIKIQLRKNAKLIIKGKVRESGSGITSNAVVLVNKFLEVGADCIIAWDTFLTDCDWHKIEGKETTVPTIICDHVWIGVGAKILKGSKILPNSIVTSMSVVMNKEFPEGALIGGNPAKVIKSQYPNWHREMSN